MRFPSACIARDVADGPGAGLGAWHSCVRRRGQRHGANLPRSDPGVPRRDDADRAAGRRPRPWSAAATVRRRPGAMIVTRLVSRPEAGALLGDVVRHEQVDSLAFGLRRRRGRASQSRPRSRPAAARWRSPRARVADASARMSSVGSSSSVRPARPQLGGGSVAGGSRRRRPPSRARRRRERGQDGVAHLGGRSARRTSAVLGQLHGCIPTISVTRAPRASAASAMATPILPVERLPMKRTGSIGRRSAGGHDDLPARRGRWPRPSPRAAVGGGPARGPAGRRPRLRPRPTIGRRLGEPSRPTCARGERPTSGSTMR